MSISVLVGNDTSKAARRARFACAQPASRAHCSLFRRYSARLVPNGAPPDVSPITRISSPPHSLHSPSSGLGTGSPSGMPCLGPPRRSCVLDRRRRPMRPSSESRRGRATGAFLPTHAPRPPAEGRGGDDHRARNRRGRCAVPQLRTGVGYAAADHEAAGLRVSRFRALHPCLIPGRRMPRCRSPGRSARRAAPASRRPEARTIPRDHGTSCGARPSPSRWMQTGTPGSNARGVYAHAPHPAPEAQTRRRQSPAP